MYMLNIVVRQHYAESMFTHVYLYFHFQLLGMQYRRFYVLVKSDEIVIPGLLDILEDKESYA